MCPVSNVFYFGSSTVCCPTAACLLATRPCVTFHATTCYDVRRRMNPGGSVKDRAALYLVSDAEKRGDLKPGGTVVEGRMSRIVLHSCGTAES